MPVLVSRQPAVRLPLWLYCGCHSGKHLCGRSVSSSRPRRTCTTRASLRIQQWILTWVVITTTQLLPPGYAHKSVVMVKGLQVLDMCIWFPSVVSSCPSNVKFDGLAYEFMADYFVDQHSSSSRHSEVVEAFAFTTWE